MCTGQKITRGIYQNRGHLAVSLNFRHYTPRENREKCLAKFRPQARQVSDMNFLGRSLIDVSGVAVVCSPFFFRNNEPRRRERPVNSPQVAERPVYNDGSSVRRNLRARRRGGKKEKYRNSRCPEN